MFYCDSGALFLNPITHVLELSNKSGQDIIPFELTHIEKYWTKRDAFILMGCDMPLINKIRRKFRYLRKNLFDKTIKIKFADFWFGKDEERVRNNYLFRLLDDNYSREITNNPDFLVYSSFGKESLKYGCLRIFYTGENVRPDLNE